MSVNGDKRSGGDDLNQIDGVDTENSTPPSLEVKPFHPLFYLTPLSMESVRSGVELPVPIPMTQAFCIFPIVFPTMMPVHRLPVLTDCSSD